MVASNLKLRQSVIRKFLFLTPPGIFISENSIKIKIKLRFLLYASLWCLKGFYEGLSLLRHLREV